MTIMVASVAAWQQAGRLGTGAVAGSSHPETRTGGKKRELTGNGAI